MKAEGWPRARFSRAHAACILGYGAAALCGLLPAWSLPGGLWLSPVAVPLFLLISVHIAASFFPAWSFFLDIISHGPGDRPAIALSFDDGPDPATTPLLLELLKKHQAPAAFFLTGRRAEACPELVARIREAGHEIGNHSMTHDTWLMVRSMRHLDAEIARCQDVLRAQGVAALAFRPPVGITNPRVGLALQKHGLICVGFSCRPGDYGNARLEGLARKVLERVKAGDVVLLHDVAPPKATVQEWLAEVERVLEGVKARGLSIVPLGELVGRQLMGPRIQATRASVAPVVAAPIPGALTGSATRE
jgi:peptidoglycan-N-acetylglucosamine deacetylase